MSLYGGDRGYVCCGMAWGGNCLYKCQHDMSAGGIAVYMDETTTWNIKMYILPNLLFTGGFFTSKG